MDVGNSHDSGESGISAMTGWAKVAVSSARYINPVWEAGTMSGHSGKTLPH